MFVYQIVFRLDLSKIAEGQHDIFWLCHSVLGMAVFIPSRPLGESLGSPWESSLGQLRVSTSPSPTQLYPGGLGLPGTATAASPTARAATVRIPTSRPTSRSRASRWCRIAVAWPICHPWVEHWPTFWVCTTSLCNIIYIIHRYNLYILYIYTDYRQSLDLIFD